MATNEHTSSYVASVAARGLDDPASLTLDEIRTVCASCLTQAPDKHAAPGAYAHYNGLTRLEPSNVAYALANLAPVQSNRLAGELSLSRLLAEELEPEGSLAALTRFRTTEPSA